MRRKVLKKCLKNLKVKKEIVILCLEIVDPLDVGMDDLVKNVKFHAKLKRRKKI
jgi:hypothetical protein